MMIQIENDIDDNNRTQWSFYVGDNLKFFLTGYKEIQRETKRHKFKVVKAYSSYNRRDSFGIDERDAKATVTVDIINSVKGRVYEATEYKEIV